MPVHEVLMKPGEWEVKFKDTTPLNQRKQAQYYGSIVITTTRVADKAISRSNLLAQSMYTGIITRRSQQLHRIGGPNLCRWWGPDQTSGPYFNGSVLPATSTWTNLMNTYCAGVNGIGIGSLSSIPGTSITTSPQSSAIAINATRYIVDAWAAACGVEYRFNPQGKVDSAAIGATGLFQQTPKVVILRGEGGRDVNYTGLVAQQLDCAEDVDSFASSVFVQGVSASGQYPASPWVGAAYSDFAGAAIGAGSYANFQRVVSSNATTNGNCTALATTNYNVTAPPKLGITCAVTEYAVPRFLIPGDYLYIHDPETDLIDNTIVPINFRGQMLQPTKVRCTGYRWPVMQGMGVYTISSDGNNTITDLTDWVEWETGQATTLEVSAMPRSLAALIGRTNQQTVGTY